MGLEWLPEPVPRSMGYVPPQAPPRQMTDGQRLRAAVNAVRSRPSNLQIICAYVSKFVWPTVWSMVIRERWSEYRHRELLSRVNQSRDAWLLSWSEQTSGQRLRRAVANIRDRRRLMCWKLAIAGTIIAVGFVLATIEFLSV